MNVLKTTLSVTAALVLAACGNGGTYQPELTNTPTVTPKPSAPSANSGGAGGSSSANNAGGGNAGSQPSTPPATGGNTGATQPPAGSGSAGNASGSQPPAGGSNAGTQPATPPATGNTNPPAPTAGNANANYAKGWVDHGGSYHEKNLPAPVAPASGSLSGDIVSISKQLNVVHSQPPAGNTDYERININGVTLSLLPGQRSDADYKVGSEAISDKQGLVAGKWLQYASYGVVDLDDEQRYGLSADRRYAFAHGEPTANMPTSGKVKYSGYAVGFTKEVNQNRPYELENHLTGKVDLDVDFGSKKVSGKVGVFGRGWFVDADINGNRFAGTSKDDTVTKGGFYGPNAAEVAGTVVNTTEFNRGVASFGAKKIDRTRYKIDRPADY